MTGYGAAEGGVAGGVLRVELRSVNHRYLNLSFKAPGDLSALESEVRERLRRDFERGHFTVSLRWLEEPAAAAGLRVDPAGAEAALRRLRDLEALSQLGGLSLELLARQPDVFTSAAEAAAAGWSEVEPVLVSAMAEMTAARRREGEVLGQELGSRLESIREHAAAVARRAPERLPRERDRLRAAVEQLLDGRRVDEDRLAQELAFLADKLDITEELVRLEAHLAAALDALAGEKAVGKQLGFLAQEIGREVNTIGSKANDAAMQHLAVEMKGELERFREQLENLE
ncbi:MAG: YicC/YloC family endoribonuclease [Gemmatimonadales bacterium]